VSDVCEALLTKKYFRVFFRAKLYINSRIIIIITVSHPQGCCNPDKSLRFVSLRRCRKILDRGMVTMASFGGAKFWASPEGGITVSDVCEALLTKKYFRVFFRAKVYINSRIIIIITVSHPQGCCNTDKSLRFVSLRRCRKIREQGFGQGRFISGHGSFICGHGGFICGHDQFPYPSTGFWGSVTVIFEF